MPNWGNGAGGLLGGLAEGMRANRDYELKRQQLEIQKKTADAQLKLHDLQQQHVNMQMQEQARKMALDSELDQTLSGQTPGVQGTTPGSYGAQGELGPFKSPEQGDQEKAKKLRDILTRQNSAVYAHADANRVDPMQSVRTAVMTMQALNNPDLLNSPGTPRQGPGPGPSAAQAPLQGGNPLDANTAAAIYREAGNDPQRARELARSRGYQIGGGAQAAPVAAAQPPRPAQQSWVPAINGKGQVSFSQPGAGAVARVQATNDAKQNTPMAPGTESTMARIDPQGEIQLAPMGLTPAQATQQGFRKVEPKVLDSARSLAPAKQALADLEGPLKQLAKENTSLTGRMSNIAGSRGELLGINLGGLAQDFGASHTGDDVKGGWLNFMQHYEGVVGGVRGASSPELQKMMELRGPQPGMNDHQIAQRVTYLKNIVRAMEGEVKNSISGGKYTGKLDSVARVNPNDLKPDQDFLSSLKKK